MSVTTPEAAYTLFHDVGTVQELKERIRAHAHLWFDEDATLTLLDRSAQATKRLEQASTFSTILLAVSCPFVMSFWVHPDGRVQWKEC